MNYEFKRIRKETTPLYFILTFMSAETEKVTTSISQYSKLPGSHLNPVILKLE